MPKLFGVEWNQKEELNSREYLYSMDDQAGVCVKKNLDPYGIWAWEEVNDVIIGGPTKTTLNNDNMYTVEIREDSTLLYEMTPDMENKPDFLSRKT